MNLVQQSQRMGLTSLETTQLRLNDANSQMRSLERTSRYGKIATRAGSCLLSPITCPIVTLASTTNACAEAFSENDNSNQNAPYCEKVLTCTFPPPKDAKEQCLVVLSPCPCLGAAGESLKLCDPCIGKPEDADRLVIDFYLRPPERQQMEDVAREITGLKKRLEQLRGSRSVNPQGELTEIAAKKNQLQKLLNTRKKVACCASVLCCPLSWIGCCEATLSSLCSRREQDQSCLMNAYTQSSSSCQLGDYRGDFWLLAMSPVPCLGQMANRCGTHRTQEIERQTKVYDEQVYLFPPERQEMRNLEDREKQIKKSPELQMQAFFDAINHDPYITGIVSGYEGERKEN